MKKVAVTGALASGKSTVCRFLADAGVYVVSADTIVHNLLDHDPGVREKVSKLLRLPGNFDRKSVAEKVFLQPSTLPSLESLLHPLVFQEIESRYNAVRHRPDILFFAAEVPLLYESKKESFFDFIITVTAGKQMCRDRCIKSGKYTEKKFSMLSQRQMPIEEKIAKSDFVLYNDGTLDDLTVQVQQIILQLTDNQGDPPTHGCRR